MKRLIILVTMLCSIEASAQILGRDGHYYVGNPYLNNQKDAIWTASIPKIFGLLTKTDSLFYVRYGTYPNLTSRWVKWKETIYIDTSSAGGGGVHPTLYNLSLAGNLAFTAGNGTSKIHTAAATIGVASGYQIPTTIEVNRWNLHIANDNDTVIGNEGDMLWSKINDSIVNDSGTIFHFSGDIFTDRWLHSATNTILGMGAGNAFTHGAGSTGWYNTLIGQLAGEDMTSGYKNTAVGAGALANTTDGFRNVAMGYHALELNTGGDYNTAVGEQAMANSLSGNNNTALGLNAAAGNTTASYNTALGANSLYSNQTSSYNTSVGEQSLYSIEGANNTALGFQTGHSNTAGSGNIYIGYQAAYNATGSNKLYIENSNSATPLIYGEFDNDLVKFNAKVQIKDVTLSPKPYFLVYDDITDEVYKRDSSDIASVDYVNDAIAQHIYDPDASIITNGTQLGGAIDSCDSHDEALWTLREATGIPGYDVQIIFDSVDRVVNRITFHGYYQGSSTHNIFLQMWDYEDEEWEIYYTLDSRTTMEWVEITIPDPQEHIQNDSCKLRFYHPTSGNTSHRLYVDYLVLSTMGFGSTSDHGELTGLSDDDHPQYLLDSDLTIAVSDLRVFPTPSADSSATGNARYKIAGDTLVFGDLCVKNSAGKLIKCDADSNIWVPAEFIYIEKDTLMPDSTGLFLLDGLVRCDAKWNWTLGGQNGMIYNSNTEGLMSQTAPSGSNEWVQAVGTAETADIMYFKPDKLIFQLE